VGIRPRTKAAKKRRIRLKTERREKSKRGGVASGKKRG
jgi:hypothetical protein